MNLAQQSNDQASFRESYQRYTEKAEATVTKVEPVTVNGTVRANRFRTYITFITIDEEEITTTV